MVCESATRSGGAEAVAIDESLELRRRGFRVGYIAAGDQADPNLEAAGVEVLLLDTRSFFEETNRSQKMQKMFWNSEIEPRLTEFLAKFSPTETVVHLHTFRLKLSGVVAHLAQKQGFTSLVHCHDYTPVCPTSLLYDHRMQANCERRPMSISCITCECQNQPWKYKLPKLTSFFWNQSVWKINRRAKGLIHISQLEKETINAKTGRPLRAFHATPIAGQAPASRVLAEENENFLFIGRLTNEKGVESFLASSREAGVLAVVVGEGPLGESLRANYPEARFTGWVGPSEIAQELSLARALVVPSVWRETLCLSVIDAMQAGVPCIVSQLVGAKEFICSGENGIIFDKDRLVEAISTFADDDTVASMSQAAFTTFTENPPTIQRHVDGLLEIYSECLGGAS